MSNFYSFLLSKQRDTEYFEIILETNKMNVDECIEKILDYLIDNKFIHFLKRPRGVFVK